MAKNDILENLRIHLLGSRAHMFGLIKMINSALCNPSIGFERRYNSKTSDKIKQRNIDISVPKI